jgi:hypothetical protein
VPTYYTGPRSRTPPGDGEASPARERREHSISVTDNPSEPPHGIHVAKGVATLLRFKSQINRDAVAMNGRDTRITVDAGDSSILEPLSDRAWLSRALGSARGVRRWATCSLRSRTESLRSEHPDRRRTARASGPNLPRRSARGNEKA